MENKLYVQGAQRVSMDENIYKCAIDCPNLGWRIAEVYGSTEKEAKDRANLIVDAFNNAGISQFLT